MIVFNTQGLEYIKGDKLKGEPNRFESKQSESSKVSSDEIFKNKKMWEKILGDKNADNLVIVWQLKNKGLPADESQMIEILKRLARREKGQYRISYDDLAEYVKEFYEKYPPSMIENLARQIQCGGDFQMAIDNSNLTAENKWLLRFVFPK